ncbi:EAL domain-containing protein [Acaryochloris sp. CCMEE 5410]|uniref:EAL domain-containing protein n=1 Tax=Acaryochloris sp. CCMEE 5410 TaxID=310037 RepID=UPI0002484323|nr:EAL domain-containing protein [Acaryochloris sp. CCMEE 5410]KAI9131747.1 PTS sugar transporter subunit IIC/EAL domain-containing protein [Acaryochloris sp. CCMEE 5410]
MYLNRLIHFKTLLLLREAFTSLLPVVLVMNIVVLLSGLSDVLASQGVVAEGFINGNEVSRLYFFLVPFFLNISLSTLMAKEKELDQVSTVLISAVCFLRVSGFLFIDSTGQILSFQGSVITSVPATLVAVTLLHYFSRFSSLQFFRGRSEVSPVLQRTLNLLIPGLLTMLCCELVGHGFRLFFKAGVFSILFAALPKLQDIQEVILFKLISQLSWFFGIHGEYSADGLFRILNEIPSSQAGSIHFKVLHDVFMNIGGSGSTFVVPLAILSLPGSAPFKSIAQLSLPFALFNVNEILLFGLPIILNPLFLAPFLLAPLVNLAIALTAIHLGVFTISAPAINWMSPPLYSAYAVSGGSGGAVLTQLLCIAIDMSIYYPFLLLAKQQSKTPLDLRKRLHSDAYQFVNTEINRQEERRFITQKIDQVRGMEETQRLLQQLKGGQFLLYFQPKVDAKSKALVGLETLLRFQDAGGKITPPTFLPILYQQGLSKAVDQKVLSLVFDQIKQWRGDGQKLPQISINLDKDFLLDPPSVKAFIAQAKQEEIYFELEITEHTYTSEVQSLASVVRDLRAAGHQVSIDDFGAGYSSLTTLVSLEADSVKLDRKLVAAPEGESQRGQVLLQSSVKLCHDLGFAVVAEGVESLSQLQLVQHCGVDFVQGYYTGKPMPSDQVSRLFQA